MTQTALDRPIDNLTLGELHDIIRQVVCEEAFSRWRLDKDGNLIFLFEKDYVVYLTEQKKKFPSEVKLISLMNKASPFATPMRYPQSRPRSG